MEDKLENDSKETGGNGVDVKMLETDQSSLVTIFLVLGPAVVTAVASYFIARLQLKIKDMELNSQLQLKVRTVLFES